MRMMRESSGKVQNGSMSVIQGISKFRVPVQLQPKPSTLNLLEFEQFVMGSLLAAFFSLGSA